MALSSLTQAQRPELAHAKPLLLVEVAMGGITLYLSTRDYVYKYGSTRVHYEGRIQTVSGVGEQSAFNQISNPKITLQLFNEPYRNYSFLSHLNDDVEFQRSTISIYEALLFDDTEVFSDADSGRTLKWKGVIERFYDLDSRNRTFKLDCCSRLHSLRNRLGLSRITTDLYPNADKTHVGQWRNYPIGDLEYVPCKLVRTGAVDTLFSNMSDGTISSFVVSGSSRIAWASSGTLQIDSEQFTYSGYSTSTKTFSGVTRARNGTTAATHSKGASVFQVLTEYVYEASCVPVGSITNVDVDAVRQTIGSSCQVYTGKPGSQLSGYGSASVVRFTVKPVIEKQINNDVEVTQEHSHTTDEGTHGHTFSGATTVVRTGIGTSVSGHVEHPDYIRDSDENTAAYLVSNSSNTQDAFLWLEMNNGSNLGTITGITVKILFSASVSNSGSSSDRLTIRYGSATVMSWSGSSGGCSLGKAWRSYAVSSSAGWSGDLEIQCEYGTASGFASIYVYEAKVEITCAPRIANAPASGVETERTGSTVVSGSSSAEAVIGREVVVTMTALADSTVHTGLPAGAITGTSGLAIKRPDHVIKYLLCSVMGISTDDIGTSFATAGAWYAANGYHLAFLTHDIATDAQELLTELAAQCRSILYEWAGKFELIVLPNFSQGDYDFEVLDGDIVSGPVYGYQSLADTANRIMVLFRKDYRSIKESGVEVSGPIKAEAADAGFMDYMEDGWGARDLDETVRLTAIRESSAAEDYLDWHVLRKKLPEKTVVMDCSWRETQVTPGMIFRYADQVEGTADYLVIDYKRDEDAKTIHLEGLLLPEWTADDSTSETVCDGDVAVVQTHVLVGSDAVSETSADSIHSLTIPVVQDATTESVCDGDLVVEQTHELVCEDCVSSSVADNGPLGTAWEYDATEDLQPASYTGVTGWWEDDTPDLMPRNTVSGADNFWEADGSGDLMPAAA